MLYPVLWMVVSSLRPGDEIFRSPGSLLDSLRTENYAEGWNALSPSFGHYLLNSAILVLGCIVGNLVSCSMAAYAFARLEFTGKRWWFGIMLGTIMLPIHVIIVPQYILFSQIGWVNTFLPLIVPKILATDAFFVFLMVQFIRGLPRELDEAARIDGCGHPRIFLRIILPLMKPALATTTIFTFIWTWNDFFSPADLPDGPGHVHGSRRPALVRRLDGRHVVGLAVRDERGVAAPDLPRVPHRPAVPRQGDRHHRAASSRKDLAHAERESPRHRVGGPAVADRVVAWRRADPVRRRAAS